MSKKVRVLLFITGLLILPSWSFRLYILYLRWGVDPHRWPTALVSFVSLAIGCFFIWMAIQGDKAGQRSYVALLLSALFSVGFWSYRLTHIILYPENDPNPAVHLRLSLTFLALSAILFSVGWRGRNKTHSMR